MVPVADLACGPFPAELIDAAKRMRVGAGVNTHDYRDRIPALVENLPMTTAKIRATMASCRARNLAEFRETARLVEVSEQTYQENIASVTIRESVGAIPD